MATNKPPQRRIQGIRGSIPSGYLLGRISQGEGDVELIAPAQALGNGLFPSTKISLVMPAQFSVAGSPVTNNGTFTVTWANESPNLVLAGPTSGGAAAPTFRALVANDIPALLNATGFANGTVSAPAIALNSNYGLFYDTTNAGVGVSVAGVEQAFFMQLGFRMAVAGGTTVSVNIQGEGAVGDTWERFSSDSAAPSNTLIKSRGTIVSPSVIQTNDFLGNFIFRGQNSTGPASFTSGASMSVLCIDTSPSPTAMGSQIKFSACAIGSGTVTEIMRMDAGTGLSMFGANPVVDANRVFRNRVFTVGTLPAGIKGMRTFVSDATSATFGADPVGGGTTNVPVFFDGTNWLIG